MPPLIKKCPYCFEDLSERTQKCPHCFQYLIDDLIEVDYHGAQKKPCIFCGKRILAEAIFCKFCRRWLDDITRAADDLKDMEDK